MVNSFYFQKVFVFLIESSYFYWEFYQELRQLFNMKMNDIHSSDGYFLFTINTILFTFHVDFVKRIRW